MSDMEMVEKAAAYLDRNVGNTLVPWLTADWRSRVNLATLRMSSIRSCVLGQLEGDFDWASGQLEDIDRQAWEDVSNTFCGFQDEWLDYLSRKPEVADKWAPGSVWTGKRGAGSITIHGVVDFDGNKTVVYKVKGWDGTDSAPESFVESLYNPPKAFKEGDILWTGDNSDPVFVYISDNRLIRLGEMVGLGTLGHGSLNFYQEEFSNKLRIATDTDGPGGFAELKSILKF